MHSWLTSGWAGMTADGSSGAAAVDSGHPHADAAGTDLRDRIRTMVRAARQERGLTQADLGNHLGTSRFTVNRIEAGATDLTLTMAEQLEQILELTGLRTLVAQRDRLVMPVDSRRD